MDVEEFRFRVLDFVRDAYPPLDADVGDDGAFTLALRYELLTLLCASADVNPSVSVEIHCRRVEFLLNLALDLNYLEEEVIAFLLCELRAVTELS